MSRAEQVDVVAEAIAKDAGWEEGTGDYDMAVETAELAVDTLHDHGFLKD